MRFIGLYISSPLEAEEILSDVFLSLWNNRAQLPGIPDFNAYLYTIARNKAVSYYRLQHMETVELKDWEVDLFFRTDTTPEDDLIAKEDVHRMNVAVNSLPDRCKMVFKLVREDRMKYKEVAAIMNISVKTVEAQMAIAVRKLSDALSPDND